MPAAYRFKFLAVRNLRGYVVLDEIYFYNAAGSVVNFPASGVATAVSFYDANSTPDKALPYLSSVWHSNTITQAMMDNGNVWWQYSFYADDVFIYRYKFKLRPDSYWANDSPTKWLLEYYNPKSGMWERIDYRENVTWNSSGQERFFDVYTTPRSINRLTTNSNYLFRTTVSGIEIYNLSYSRVGFISSGSVYTQFFTSAWASENYLYIGTSVSGVVRTPMSAISSGIYNWQPYKNVPQLTAAGVVDIHGTNDYLCVATVSGVDEFNLSTDSRYYTTVSGVSRCFQTASGIYYVTQDALHSVYDLASNWTTPSYLYNKNTHPAFFGVSVIEDLHIVDGLIYLATNNGVLLLKENRGMESLSPYKRFKEK